MRLYSTVPTYATSYSLSYALNAGGDDGGANRQRIWEFLDRVCVPAVAVCMSAVGWAHTPANSSSYQTDGDTRAPTSAVPSERPTDSPSAFSVPTASIAPSRTPVSVSPSRPVSTAPTISASTTTAPSNVRTLPDAIQRAHWFTPA